VPLRQRGWWGRLWESRWCRWCRWLAKPPARIVGTSVLTGLSVLAIIFAMPADGGTDRLAARIAKAVGLLSASSHQGRSFQGTPAVGALFAISNGKLGTHFCTASVIHSPHGDLLITAAHCVTGTQGTGTQGTIAFVPGYANGNAPYGIWYVTQVFTDQAWASSSNPDDDVAFLTVSQHNAIVPIEDVTGAEKLGIGLPSNERARVVGYPNGANEPIFCNNWTRAFSATQLEFDCDGYTDGTSGAPFLVQVDRTSGQGTVIGVIGGYEEGGDVPSVSYSVTFGRNVSSLYRTAAAAS
jgi:V8-like Glu-specific endopeptidase